MTSIEEYAFYGCNGFKGSLIIPDTVTSIGYLSFYGCNGFTGSLIIPKSVTSIGSAAFQGCTNLEKIIFTGNTDPSTMRNYPWDFDPGKIEWQPSQEGA